MVRVGGDWEVETMVEGLGMKTMGLDKKVTGKGWCVVLCLIEGDIVLD